MKRLFLNLKIMVANIIYPLPQRKGHRNVTVYKSRREAAKLSNHLRGETAKPPKSISGEIINS